MQIESGPTKHQLHEVHHPFVWDDIFSYQKHGIRKIIQNHRLVLPGYPDLYISYIATHEETRYRINCQIDTKPLLKQGLIQLDRYLDWKASFTDEEFEYKLSTLRPYIQLADKSEHLAYPNWNRVTGGLYQFTDWTQTEPYPNGRLTEELLLPDHNLLDLRAMFISTRPQSLNHSFPSHSA